MMAQAGRRAQPAGDETPWIITGVILIVGVLVFGAYWLGAVTDPQIRQAAGSANPLEIIAGQTGGSVPFTIRHGLVFAGGTLLVLGIAAVIGWAAWKQMAGRSRLDNRARSMVRAKDMAEMAPKAAEVDAQRLGATGASSGVPLGRLVNNNTPLLSSWEWVQMWICGPRAGKTSCVCVPQILETRGPVVATSNKRDIVDLTRGPRSRDGVVWVYDVQSIIGEKPSWYWNPLSYVEDYETAERLADVFISSATSAEAKKDAYFDSAGKETLARLFLAAATDDRPITDVFRWANDPDDFTPVKALLNHGHGPAGDALEKTQTLTPKQRDGVYGTMRPWITVLGNEKVVPWMRPNGDLSRPEFDPHAFVTSRDTLYLVSQEGSGSAQALTAALAMVVLSYAEKIAASQPGGRLSVPLMAVLDEAANVVRWRDLPDKYSHYGSRGIVVSTFFQSWSQAVEAFGKTGTSKMWSAANVRVVGSGLAEDQFLPFVSTLVGERDVIKRTSSTQKNHRSVSTSVQRERILDAAELAALPRGRAVLMSSGNPAALVALEHFSRKPYADDVVASRNHYEQRAATATSRQR